MANLFYENLPDGMHDVLMGPQEGLFLTGYDSLRRLCLVLYAPPFGQRMRVLSQLPYRDYGRYTPTVLGAHDAPRSALYVLLYQTPISWGIERMSLYRIHPDSGKQVLLSDSHAPFWAPTAILPRPDGSVLIGLSGYGPLMRYHGCNDTACQGLDTLNTAASNATGKAGMADISGPDGSRMLCLVVGADQLLGRSGTVVCERPDGSLQTIWSEEDGTLVPRGGSEGGGDDEGGISNRKGPNAVARDGASAATSGASGPTSVSRGRALERRRTAAELVGGDVAGAKNGNEREPSHTSGHSDKRGDEGGGALGAWPGRTPRARPDGAPWQRQAAGGPPSAAAGAVQGVASPVWEFNPAWREPDHLTGAKGRRLRGAGNKGGGYRRRLSSDNGSLPWSQPDAHARREAMSYLHNPSSLARGPSVQLAYGGGGGGGGGGAGPPRAADSILIVSRDSMSEFGMEQGSVHALLPREPRDGEECGAAGCWDPPRPLATSLSNPGGVAVDENLGKLYVLEQNTLHGSNYELFEGDVLEFCVAGYYDCSAGQNSGECLCAPGFGGACCDMPAGAAGLGAVLATAGMWATFAPPLLAAVALLYFGTRTRRSGADHHGRPAGARGEWNAHPAESEAGGAAGAFGGEAGAPASSLQEPLCGDSAGSSPTRGRVGRSGTCEGSPDSQVRRSNPWGAPARLTARSYSVTSVSGSAGVAGTSVDHAAGTDRDAGREGDRSRNASRGHAHAAGRDGRDIRNSSSSAQLYHSMLVHPDTQPDDELGEPSDRERQRARMPRPTTRTGLAEWLASGFGGMDFLSSRENSMRRGGATQAQQDTGGGRAPRGREP
jgi:hypothetical protein